MTLIGATFLYFSSFGEDRIEFQAHGLLFVPPLMVAFWFGCTHYGK